MDLSQFNSFAPLAASVGYTTLIVAGLVRRGRRERVMWWLTAFLSLSIVWEFLILHSGNLPFLPNLSIKLLLLSTAILGALTAAYAEWAHANRWLKIGAFAIVIGLLADLIPPALSVKLPGPNALEISFSNVISHLLWLMLASYLTLATWHHYRRTQLQWHANRLLFWLLALLLTFAGEAMLLFHWTGLTMLGQLSRFVGILGVAYALFSHRIFDVRTRSRSAITILLVTLVSASPIAGAVLLTQWLARAEPGGTNGVLTVIGVGTGLLFYQPIRRFVERIAHRYLMGEAFTTSSVVRSYSQAVYRTLDVEQLALVAVGTLSDLLEAKYGALMLITETPLGYGVKPIPMTGVGQLRQTVLPPSSPLLKMLVQQHQPLLQYDIDFNPDFAELSPSERSWLKELSMEVYVPISTGREIVGLLAVGPRYSGVPYQPSELELAQILADQTVVALQNSRLYSELASQNEKIRQLNVNLVSQNERLEIMDRVKSDFITIASHELRTPLTQVKGYADILAAMNEENSLSQDQTRGIVGHINRATLLLEGLISAMLDASQIDVDGMQLAYEPTRLTVVVDLATQSLRDPMRERRIALSTEGLDECPIIQADIKRLTQAFSNLISNAVKYTPDHGSIMLSASSLPVSNGAKEYIEIVIADTGIGIDPRFHDLIFEKFFRTGDPQLHSTGSTKFKGAGPGLGLPIAKGVIEAHGGRIWVESASEDEARLPGSRFHIILPVQPPEPESEPEWDAELSPPLTAAEEGYGP
jgi:signal transduction histidine kinase